MAKMEEILTFAVFAAILLLIPKIQSQSDVPPLCITQFALVNHACAFLPYTPPDDDDTPPSPPDDDDSTPPSPPDDDSDGGGGGGDDQGRFDNGNNYNQSLVDDDSGDDHHNHHHHHRHHRHRHRQGHSASDVEDECCRWLKEVDDECVCGLLLRLPPYLSKLEHDYTVIVNDDCEVTFECPGKYGE
ncbi:uncharacterized protein LOC131313266 isoform X1 [Rhododendron vialii]|uniref:uncharacterized protein LOC131313266 isoform X1 n=1 Tax=Rhododendron vialii TaxID=182163 RepID=UPI00265D8912|nr:uncharacterized protein LOC131313266 isoform X1 [Rhododendron vialii]